MKHILLVIIIILIIPYHSFFSEENIFIRVWKVVAGCPVNINTNELPKDRIKGALIIKNTESRPIGQEEDEMILNLMAMHHNQEQEPFTKEQIKTMNDITFRTNPVILEKNAVENVFDNALENLFIALDLKSNYPKAHATIGIIYSDLEDYTKAIYYFEQAISYDRRDYRTMSRLAELYNILLKHDSAKKYAKDCIKVKRNFPKAYYELGIAEKGLGNRIAAISAFDTSETELLNSFHVFVCQLPEPSLIDNAGSFGYFSTFWSKYLGVFIIW